MPITSINAYFMAVDEAHAEVKAAQARLSVARDALETKKKEVDWVEPTASAEVADTTPNPEPNTGGVFRKK